MAYMELLTAVISQYLNKLRKYDYKTYTHSLRVAILSDQIGVALKLNLIDLHQLIDASLLHDIGKLRVSKKILNKPDKLNAAEWSEILNHPYYGVKILTRCNQKISPEIINAIYCHHEFFNGKGYPRGIKGKTIPLLARIISIADALDAMTTQRSYRKAELEMKEAVNEILNNAGTQFDPDIAMQLPDIQFIEYP